MASLEYNIVPKDIPRPLRKYFVPLFDFYKALSHSPASVPRWIAVWAGLFLVCLSVTYNYPPHVGEHDLPSDYLQRGDEYQFRRKRRAARRINREAARRALNVLHSIFALTTVYSVATRPKSDLVSANPFYGFDESTLAAYGMSVAYFLFDFAFSFAYFRDVRQDAPTMVRRLAQAQLLFLVNRPMLNGYVYIILVWEAVAPLAHAQWFVKKYSPGLHEVGHALQVIDAGLRVLLVGLWGSYRALGLLWTIVQQARYSPFALGNSFHMLWVSGLLLGGLYVDQLVKMRVSIAEVAKERTAEHTKAT